MIFGALAAGGYALAKKAAPAPAKPDTRGQIVAEASKHAQRRMARGASAEEAAAWAANRVADSYQSEKDETGEVAPDFFSQRKVSERYRF
jgi:hypothetical protein